jgi:hypothetical protein
LKIPIRIDDGMMDCFPNERKFEKLIKFKAIQHGLRFSYPIDFPTKLTEDPSDLSKTIIVLGKH